MSTVEPTTNIQFPRSMREMWHQFVGNGAAAHPLVQFAKYAFVGAVATIVNMVCFFLFAWYVFPCITEGDVLVRILHLTPPPIDESSRGLLVVYSNVAAFIPANVVCYILNRVFVFTPGRLSVCAEAASFFAVSAFSIFVGSTVAKLLVDIAGAQTSLAFVCNLVASMMFNYVLRKFIIFKN